MSVTSLIIKNAVEISSKAIFFFCNTDVLLTIPNMHVKRKYSFRTKKCIIQNTSFIITFGSSLADEYCFHIQNTHLTENI